MKTILTVLLLIAALGAGAQTANYGEITKKGYYKQYITKTGLTIKPGDKITIGTGTTQHGYAHITQANKQAAHHLAGKTVTVNKFKAVGNKNIGYTMYVAFKGYGMAVYIDYENALKTGEILKPE